MAQHDYNIAGGTGVGGLAIRTDINEALAAIVSNNSGASEPSVTFAYQWWADTTAGLLKRRNAANTGWISVMSLSSGLLIGTDVHAHMASAPQAEMEAGTEPALRAMSPLRVAQAIAAQARPISSGMAVNSTSGVAIDFTAIPSWVKLVKLMLDQVSTNGSSPIIVQIGDSGGIETSGYSGSSQLGTGAYGPHTNGLNIFPSNAAANVISGVVTIALLSSGVYSMASTLGVSNSGGMAVAAASKTLSSAPMDRIRITTAGGTDAFDGGLINILYK